MFSLVGLRRTGASVLKDAVKLQNARRNAASVTPGPATQPQVAQTVGPSVDVSKAGKKGRKRVTTKGKDGKTKVVRRRPDRAIRVFGPLPPAQLQPTERFAHNLFEGVSSLNPPSFNSKNLSEGSIGSAAQFRLPDNDPVRIFGLPKNILLEYRLLSKPCTVIRDATIQAIDMLKKAEKRSSLDTRVVFTGRNGCGKSFLLLQALEHCATNNWVVIYIPRAVNLVNSTTSYAYDLRTQTYVQSTFAFQTLQRMQTVNATILRNIKIRQKLSFEKRDFAGGTSLYDVIGIARREMAQSLAPAVLEAVFQELEAQTSYPVLLAVDNFQALYCKTNYRDPQFHTIRPYHLSMPRLIMEFASGQRSFTKGAFLGAVSNSDPLYPVPLELQDVLGLENDRPISPYKKRSQTLLKYAEGLRPFAVPEKLQLNEASTLFELWMKDRALPTNAYDEAFLSKYVESGGNARDFVWKGLLSSFVS